jgi:hypothetical protein
LLHSWFDDASIDLVRLPRFVSRVASGIGDVTFTAGIAVTFDSDVYPSTITESLDIADVVGCGHVDYGQRYVTERLSTSVRAFFLHRPHASDAH